MKPQVILFTALLFILLSFMSEKTVCSEYEGVDNQGIVNVYHVSVNGSDTNAGSNAKPFKTISAAASVAMPGDVITVHSGVYREQISPPGA